jgi:hypothetical protein
VIHRSGHITFEGIDRAWRRSSLNSTGDKLSYRTFFHHKDAILLTFGIDIKCDRSLGYYISNSDEIESDSIRNWMLQALSLNSIMNEGAGLHDRIICEEIPSSQKWLPDLMTAMRDGRYVEVTYQNFRNDSPCTFQVAPYCLKLFRQRWYMLGKSGGYDNPRIYSLDRITDLDQTGRNFRLPEGFDPKETFRKHFGIMTDDSPVETVVLKVPENQADYYRTLPLHHTQEEIESKDGYTTFTYRLVPTFDFTREIMSKGMYAEVLSPAWLRSEVAQELHNAVRLYEDQQQQVYQSICDKA